MIKIFREINRLRPYFGKEEKFRYILLFLGINLGALLDVIGIGVIPGFVALLAAPEQFTEYPFMQSLLDNLGLEPGLELILYGSLFLVGVFIVKNAYLVLLYNFQFTLVQGFLVSLSHQLFEKYMNAPFSFLTSRNTAELMRNVQVESQEVVRGIMIQLLNVVMGVVMTTFTLLLLVLSTPYAALIGFLIVGGGSAFFFHIIRGRLEYHGEVSKRERKETIKSINQGLGAAVDARILGRAATFIDIYHRSLDTFARVDRYRQVINRISPSLLETISVIGLLFIILTLVYTGMPNGALIPTLALFGAATMRLRQTIALIINGLSQIQYSLPAINNIVEDMEYLEGQELRVQLEIDPEADLTLRQTIRIDNVHFRFPEVETPTLDGITFDIQKGQSVALVGSTGSGKSTMINVILGLLRPEKGSVLVDGTPITKNPTGWFRQIGYIPQTIFLTDESIRKNIAFGLPDTVIDEKQLEQAVHAAQLQEFVQSLPDGLETVVGERGVRLSGGQRQRIGLARALYHDPDILVMDEATSALDNHTEDLVMRALEELKGNRTMIIIAHRLTTVMKCDQIHFLEQGRLRSSGTYHDLVFKDELFKKMAELVQ